MLLILLRFILIDDCPTTERGKKKKWTTRERLPRISRVYTTHTHSMHAHTRVRQNKRTKKKIDAPHKILFVRLSFCLAIRRKTINFAITQIYRNLSRCFRRTLFTIQICFPLFSHSEYLILYYVSSSSSSTHLLFAIFRWGVAIINVRFVRVSPVGLCTV